MSAFFAWPGPSGRENFRIGQSLIAAVVCGLVTMASHAAEPKLLKIPAGTNWQIEIVPGPAIGPSPNPKFELAMKQALAAKTETSSAPATGVVTAGAESAMPTGITSASYTEVYNSIPFRRSEYAANPNYRHDSTMEILTGHPRHQTIVQHNHEHKQPVQRTPAPARPSRVLTPFSGMSYFWNLPLWNYRGF